MEGCGCMVVDASCSFGGSLSCCWIYKGMGVIELWLVLGLIAGTETVVSSNATD